MKDDEFSRLSSIIFDYLINLLDNFEQDDVINFDIEEDLIEINTCLGVFIINKHFTAKQIWLSSPLTGPYHFSYVDNCWKSNKNEELISILEKELNYLKDIK